MSAGLADFTAGGSGYGAADMPLDRKTSGVTCRFLESPCQQRPTGLRKSLRCFAPGIAMMEATQACAGNHRRLRRWLLLDRPAIGCVLGEGVVNTVFLVVADVISHQSPEVLFVQRDHVIQQLAPATPNPPLCGAILPGCLDARESFCPLVHKSASDCRICGRVPPGRRHSKLSPTTTSGRSRESFLKVFSAYLGALRVSALKDCDAAAGVSWSVPRQRRSESRSMDRKAP